MIQASERMLFIGNSYDVLALILEKVTGQRYEDYISSTVINGSC